LGWGWAGLCAFWTARPKGIRSSKCLVKSIAKGKAPLQLSFYTIFKASMVQFMPLAIILEERRMQNPRM
jgi:hypothetical protein